MSAQPDTTSSVPADGEPVEIIGWLIAQLVRQYDDQFRQCVDQIEFRRDLQNVLGVEFVMPELPEPPEVPKSTHIEHLDRVVVVVKNELAKIATERGLRNNEVGRSLAKLARAVTTTPPTTVRRVERDENGRILRIVDEAVPPK